MPGSQRTSGPNGELRAHVALLAGGRPDSARGSEGEAGGLRRRDFADAVGKIDAGVRSRVRGEKLGPHDRFCRGVSRVQDCDDTVGTIGLEPLRRDSGAQGYFGPRILRRDGPIGTMERPDPAGQDRLPAFSAHRAFAQTRETRATGTGGAPRAEPALARPRVPRSLFAFVFGPQGQLRGEGHRGRHSA